MSQQRDEGLRSAMSRRTFVGAGVLGGALAAAGPLAGRAAAARLEAAPAGKGSAGPLQPPPFEFEEATVAQLRDGLDAGKYTARSLAESYLARIEAVDPWLHSVLEVDKQALARADALDAERKAKGPRGPLHGIPVLIKANIATLATAGPKGSVGAVGTADLTTTAGSLALLGSLPPRDAFLIERLRAAGALLLGKTNLSEWANFRSTHSSSGWSGQGGQCRNPYALDRSPSGSSSGSGVAAASSFTAVAVGTETDGSIVSPAAACSLVGIKPTVGLISRAGIVPISHTQDTAGPMARTVADAAVLLGVLAGIDPRDEATAASRGKAHADYTKFLDPDGLKGARIGIPRKRLFGYSPKTDALAEEAIAVLKKLGATVVDPADLDTVGQFDDDEFAVLLYEFKADLAKYFADLQWAGRGTDDPPIRSLADVIAFNERHRDVEMPGFGQEIMLMAEAKGPLSDDAYKKALTRCRDLSRGKGIDATLAKHKLDALFAPTQGPPWLIDPVNGDSASGSSTSPAAVAGYPSITVPAGYVDGLPVGMSFFGAAWSEPALIRFAYAFEQATKARRAPRFLPTVQIGEPG